MDCEKLPKWLTAYLERCLKLEEDGLTEEYLSRLETETAYLSLRQLDVLARP